MAQEGLNRKILIIDDGLTKDILAQYLSSSLPNFTTELLQIPSDCIPVGRNIVNCEALRTVWLKIKYLTNLDFIIFLLSKNLLDEAPLDQNAFVPHSLYRVQDFMNVFLDSIGDKKVTFFFHPPIDIGSPYDQRLIRIDHITSRIKICEKMVFRKSLNHVIIFPDEFMAELNLTFPNDPANLQTMQVGFDTFFHPYGQRFQTERLRCFTDFILERWVRKEWCSLQEIFSPPNSPFNPPPPSYHEIVHNDRTHNIPPNTESFRPVNGEHNRSSTSSMSVTMPPISTVQGTIVTIPDSNGNA